MRITAAALTAATLLLSLTACGSDADPAACKTAMAKQLDAAAAAGDQAKPGTQPDACKGLDAETLQRLAGEVTTERLKGDQDAADLEQDLADLEAEIDGTLDGLETPAP